MVYLQRYMQQYNDVELSALGMGKIFSTDYFLLQLGFGGFFRGVS